MRTAYHEALEKTRLDVVRLGALATDALHSAVAALEERDVDLAARVIAGDDEIDGLRRQIEGACIELMWKQQPLAGELRQVAAMLQINTDLERIGDYAVDIGKNAVKLVDAPIRPAHVEIGRMGHEARQMVVDAMRAFSEASGELADAVIARDDRVDLLYHRGIEKLQAEMQADPAVVRAGTLLLFSLAVLERVGDRAQNIAWHTKEMIGTA
ncbi:MAG: phosphate signaling complex protein PhoU [Candidatus Eremiobacteraeota bacterium]|nr:phosphate signaling complex protein PhoU [Candidatus Eremiobacteraeota bacterium]